MYNNTYYNGGYFMKIRLVLFAALMAVGLCGAQQKSDRQKLSERTIGATGFVLGWFSGLMYQGTNEGKNTVMYGLLSLIPLNIIIDGVIASSKNSIEEVNGETQSFCVGSLLGYLGGVLTQAIAQGKFDNIQISVKS